MNTLLAKGKKLIGRAAIVGVALGGFLSFFGAGTASARPVYRHYPPVRVVVGGPRYFAPRPVVVYRPAFRPGYYGYRPYHRVAIRYWDPYYHCWRFRY